MKSLALIAALAALSVPAHAQTARRLWLLCNQEDPQCGPMLRAATQAYEANPTWGRWICRPTRELTPQELYVWFMRIVPIESVVWEEPARIGVWEAMHNANACQSEAR